MKLVREFFGKKYFSFFRENFSAGIAGIILVTLSLGYFTPHKLYDILHIVLICLLLFTLSISFYIVFFKQDDNHRNGFSLLLLAGTNIAIQQFHYHFPQIYTMNYISVSLITALSGWLYGMFSSSIILFLDLSMTFQEPGPFVLKTPAINFFINILFSSAIGLYLFAESREKDRVEIKYKNIIQKAESLQNPSHPQMNFSDPGLISREERQKRFLRSSLALDEKIHRAMEVVKQSLHSHSCVLFLKDNKTERFHVRDVISDTDDIAVDNIDVRQGVLGWVFNKKKSIYLSEFNGVRGIPYYSRNPGIRTFLAVPIMKDGEDAVSGILCGDSIDVQAFNEEHKKLLIVMGNQILETIENTEIQNQILSEMVEFASFYEVSKKLASSLNLSDVLSVTLDSALRIVSFDFGAIVFWEQAQKSLTISSFVGKNRENMIQKEFTSEGSLTGYILQNHNKTYLIGDSSQKKTLQPLFGGKLQSPEFLSLLLIPLNMKNNSIGAMIFGSVKSHFFTTYESEIFEVLGNQVTVAIENARIYKQMEAMAVTDGLTKLYNHRRFQEILDMEIKRVLRYNTGFSLLLLDIDYFKNVNDTRGHPVGDEVLKRVANIMNKFVREIDYTCRYGGEEFAVILPNATTKDTIVVAERIRKGVEKSTFIFNSRDELFITVSIGIASFPSDAKTKQDLIDRADQSLYYAKESGRNQTQTYEGLRSAGVV